MPTLIAIHQMQNHILQFLMNAQVHRAKKPILATESIFDDSLQGVTPATNTYNLSVAGRLLASATEELVAFMTRSEVEAMLKNENDKASLYMIFLDLKQSYYAKVAAKSYPLG